jgi:sugar-specific transcriptional regulator TrmB
MKEQALLESLGLKDAEARTYLALLKAGPSSIRTLAALAGINRGAAYESLKHLTTIGLVSFQQRGDRRKYLAESPERIYDLLDDRKRELAKLAAAAETLVPALRATTQSHLGQPVVRFYEDDEGIATILRDVLSTVAKTHPKEYYAHSSRPLRRYIYRRFPDFTRRRITAGIFVKVIAVGGGGETADLSERRQLPEPPGEYLSSYMIIYGPKVALISISADDTPNGVVIEGPGVAAMHKYLFDALWAGLQSEQTEKGE